MTRDESRDVGVWPAICEAIPDPLVVIPWKTATSCHAHYVPVDHLFATEARLMCAVAHIESLERALVRQQEIALEDGAI